MRTEVSNQGLSYSMGGTEGDGPAEPCLYQVIFVHLLLRIIQL